MFIRQSPRSRVRGLADIRNVDPARWSPVERVGAPVLGMSLQSEKTGDDDGFRREYVGFVVDLKRLTVCISPFGYRSTGRM